MFDKKIKALIILEVLGRPKEHLVETLKKMVETIGKENGIKVLNSNIHEAKLYERKDEKGNVIKSESELFTSFAEIEFECDNIVNLFGICFTYMPSSVEIIEPERVSLKNIEFNSIANEIIRRLHHYDSIAKSAIMNNKIIADKLRSMQNSQGNSNPALNELKVVEQAQEKSQKSEKNKGKGKKGKKNK